MKKIISKLFALAMAVVILLSMVLCVGAQEFSIRDFEDWKTADHVDSSIANCAAFGEMEPGTENFSAADNAGVFVLRMKKGMDVKTIGAFLVEDGDENLYLLTHQIALAYAQDGYELTIMVPGGENIAAACVAYDETFQVAYLYAPGMSFYNPLKFTPDPFVTTISAGLGFADEQVTVAKRIEYKSFDFSKWVQLNPIAYCYKDREFTWNWVGAPIFPGTKEYNVQGIGTYAENQDGQKIIAVINFEEMVLTPGLSLAAIESGSLEQEPEEKAPAAEPAAPPAAQPEPEPESGFDKRFLIVGVVIAALVGCYFYSTRKNKPVESENNAQDVPNDITIAEDFGFNVTRPMATWQLRSLGGPLGDKNFPISGTTLIGRGSGADIRFPESTPGISGRHCEVAVSGDSVILRDVGSSYGTFAGQTRLSPNVDQPIFAGDTFTLAKNGPTFRLERIGSSEDGSDGPAVRNVQGKNFRADGKAKLTFGRKSGNHVQIADNAVSSAHCVLYHEGGKLYLKDLDSSNGTFFNEKERLRPNTPYRVRKGMSFYLSSPANTFVITEE